MAMYSFRIFEIVPRFLSSQCYKFPDPPIPVFLTVLTEILPCVSSTTERTCIEIYGKK
jgi:hypothetical protein